MHIINLPKQTANTIRHIHYAVIQRERDTDRHILMHLHKWKGRKHKAHTLYAVATSSCVQRSGASGTNSRAFRSMYTGKPDLRRISAKFRYSSCAVRYRCKAKPAESVSHRFLRFLLALAFSMSFLALSASLA